MLVWETLSQVKEVSEVDVARPVYVFEQNSPVKPVGEIWSEHVTEFIAHWEILEVNEPTVKVSATPV